MMAAGVPVARAAQGPEHCELSMELSALERNAGREGGAGA